MADDTLAYVTQVDTPGSQMSETDILLGEAQLSDQTVLTLRPFSTGNATTEQVPVTLGQWGNVSQGGWVRKRTQGSHVTVTPLGQLTSPELAALITPDVTSYLNSNPNLVDTNALQDAISQGSTTPPPFITALKPSSGRPRWTAAPVPHWARVIGDEQSEPDASGNIQGLPEMSLGENYMRIGTVCFLQAVGPMDMHVTIVPQIESSPALRQNTEMKRIGGMLRKTISFSMLFTSEAAIRGELMPFLRQSRRAPFMPIVHSGLLHQHGITAIALQSCSLSTVAEHPNALQLNVICYPFPEIRYLLDGDILDTAINYPLLELWLASDSRYYTDAYGTGGLRSQDYQDTSFDTPVWNGQLSLATPSRDWLDLVNENETEAERALSKGQVPATSLENAAKALSGDTGALAAIPSSTVDGASTLPVVTIRDFTVHYPPDTDSPYTGAWVAILVTPDVAPYAFLPEEQGGAAILLKDWSYQNAGADLTGNGVTGAERQNLNNGINVVGLSGQYLALWHVGTKYSLPKGTDGQPITLPDGLEVAASKAAIDPNNPQFTIPVQLSGFTIEAVSAGMVNALAEISPGDADTPEYQVMGSSDFSMTFSGVCDVNALGELYSILYEVSSLAVDYRGTWDGTPYGGYCKLDNEVAQILGVQYVIPTQFSVDTMDNFPTHRRVSISFVGFDPVQRKIEAPSDYSNVQANQQPTAIQSDSDYLDRCAALQAMEKALDKIELYPDIQPPTWAVLQTWVRDLQDGKVWDEGDAKAGRAAGPYENYSFLTNWHYTATWLQNHGAEFIEQSTPYAGGEEAPLGYADPDFWCCGRGVIDSPTGEDFVTKMVKDLNSEKAETVYASSDGVYTSVRQGDPDHKGIQVSGSSLSAASIAEMQKSAKNADADHPQILGVPLSARDTQSSVNVTSPTSEPSVASGLGTPLSSTSGINSEDRFYQNLGPDWKSGNRALKAGAVLYAAKKLGVPLALAANMMLQESNDADLVDASRDGADSTGPVQITAENFPSTFRRAVQLGLFPQGTHPDHLNVSQTAAAGLVEYKGYYDTGYTKMGNSGLSDAERQYYAWIYATAAYNGGEGGTGVRTYLKNGGDPRLIAQHINIATVRTDYVPDVFGNGPRVKTGAITLADFTKSAASAPTDGFVSNGAYYPPATPTPTQTTAAPVASSPDVSGAKSGLVAALGVVAAVIPGAAPLAAAAATTIADAPTPAQGYEQIHNRVWDYDRAAYDPEAGEDIFYAARKSDQTGRLLRAYPSQCVLLVDGGKWIGFYHLTDLFYGLHSPMDITVYESRLTPAGSCTIAFADPYGNLSSQSADVELTKRSSTQRNFGIDDIFKGVGATFAPNDDIKLRRSEELKSLLVKPGNRLHVRMGYGSSAASLPTVFNGTVTGVEKKADVLVVTGLGDGYELTSQLSPAKGDAAFYQNIGGLGGGQEVRNIILDILAVGQNETAARVLDGINAVAAVADTLIPGHLGTLAGGVLAGLSGGNFGQQNPYGIEHFGDVIRNKWLVADCAEIGINIYSGWGDQPVNVTVAAEDGPLGAIAELIDNGTGQSKDVGQRLLEWADPKYAENYDGMGTNKLWRCLQGEELVGIRMENATPWGVFDELRKACLDYIVAVEHFGLRSSLFFGKDWWPFHYKYDYDYVNTARGLTTAANVYTDQSHAAGLIAAAQDTGNETQNVEPIYRRRPFVQVHVCHSGTNLIACEIEATQEGWARNVQATGSYAGTLESQQVETSMVQYLDSDIYPQFQNMKLVQSGLYSTTNMRAHDAAAHLDPAELFMSTNVLNNYAVGALHDEVREMYQGDVYQTGNGYLRPRHLVHLIDAMRQLSGPVEVKEVTHAFGMSGFITTWSPDCVAFAQDTQKFPLVTHMLQFGARYYGAKAALAFSRSQVGSYVLRKGLRVSLGALSKLDEVIANTGGAGLRYVGYDLKRIGSGILDRTPLAKVHLLPISHFKEINGLPIDQKQVLAALENEIGGKNRRAQWRRHQLRVTKKAVLKNDSSELIYKIRRAVTAKATTPLTNAQNHQVDAYIERVLFKDKQFFGLGDPLLKRVEDTPEGLASLDKPSYLRWVAEKLGPTNTPLQGTLLDYFKANDRFRDANNRIQTPSAKRGALEYFQSIVGDKDVFLRDALARTLGSTSGEDVELGDLTASLSSRLDEARAALETRKAGANANTAAEKAAIAADERAVENATNALNRYKKVANAAKSVSGGLKKAAGLVKFGGEAGGIAGKVGKVVGGIPELVVQVVIGGAITQLNRYLASRQALKILPLQSAHKEWTAGINGHLGSVVGDPLGPADATIRWALGSGPGTAQNALSNGALTEVLSDLPGPFEGLNAGARLGEALNINTTGTILGINDPHYGTDGDFHELVAAYGLPKPQALSVSDMVEYQQQNIKRLALISTLGLTPAGVTQGSDPTGIVGANGTIIPAGPGGSYASQTNSTVGQNYAKVVRDLALYIGDPSQSNKPQADAQVDGDLAPSNCQRRIQRVMNAEGNTTSYYPQAATAWLAYQALLKPPYSQYWQQVAGSVPVTSASIPQGALCYWPPTERHRGAGHVAIVYRYNGRTFLIGNSGGNTALDVTYAQGYYATVSAAFLPK